MVNQNLEKTTIETLVKTALQEDDYDCDITTQYIIPSNTKGSFSLIAKEDGILCGIDFLHATFKHVSKDIILHINKVDGEAIRKNEVIGKIEGSLNQILAGERVALNFLQMLSGISSLTNQFIQILGNQSAIIIRDTRKTTPTLRAIEKYAVIKGGGQNHRNSLKDFILIKDNHLNWAMQTFTIKEIIQKYRQSTNSKYLIELEVETIEQAKEAMQTNIDLLLLDNMSIEEIKKITDLNNNNIKIEISGGVNLNNISDYKNLDIDFIAIGAITHSAKFLDISMELN
jgi:nicotinate-nucleotide pyrophosphorylase (carboxylating)